MFQSTIWDCSEQSEGNSSTRNGDRIQLASLIELQLVEAWRELLAELALAWELDAINIFSHKHNFPYSI